MEERIGPVIRFFEKNSVAAIKLDFRDLGVGDTIRIKRNGTDFTRKIDAMKFGHKRAETAIRGQLTGVRLSQPARPFDIVSTVKG